MKVQPGERGRIRTRNPMKKWKQISTSGTPSKKENPHQILSVHTHRIPTLQEIKRLNYFLNLGNDLPLTFKNAYGLNQVLAVI